MIQRQVNVNDLSNFDFFNDAKDTINWLAYDRKEEAKIIEEAEEAWSEEYVKNLLTNIKKSVN